MLSHSYPIIAIVGRPNVGKSALFNRLVGKRTAIVDKEPGVTRDRIYGTVEWNKRQFQIVDTGGLLFGQEDHITQKVEKQVNLAIAEAEKIIFLVDVQNGITALDREIADLLRPIRQKVILGVNKVDQEHLSPEAQEFHELGFEPMLEISSMHGKGIGELLDTITDALAHKELIEKDESIQIAVVGKPNAGKSSFTNAILKEERSIVSEIPGTTRDSIDTQLIFKGELLTLIDTAGIRRKRKVRKAVDYFSIVRARSSIKKANVVILMLDGSSGITSGDLKIAAEVHEAGKSCLILVNKWDLLEGTSQKDFRLDVYDRLGFLNYSPILVTSVKTGKNLKRSLEEVLEIHKRGQVKIGTKELNKFFKEITTRTPPPVVGTKPLKIYYITQVGMAPIQLLAFVNNSKKMKDSYRQFLVNQCRKKFGFEGVPIILRCKTSV